MYYENWKIRHNAYGLLLKKLKPPDFGWDTIWQSNHWAGARQNVSLVFGKCVLAWCLEFAITCMVENGGTPAAGFGAKWSWEHHTLNKGTSDVPAHENLPGRLL